MLPEPLQKACQVTFVPCYHRSLKPCPPLSKGSSVRQDRRGRGTGLDMGAGPDATERILSHLRGMLLCTLNGLANVIGTGFARVNEVTVVFMSFVIEILA